MSFPVTSTTRRFVRHVVAVLFIALTAAAGLAMDGGPVSAHTEFSGSTPSDGDVVDAPVESVSLVFTGEAEESGDGFVALDASGQIREPDDVSTVDNQVFTLSFDPALAGGDIGIRWNVLSADGHPISGAFSFTVTAPLPTTTTTTTAPSTTIPPPTTAPTPAASPATTDVADTATSAATTTTISAGTTDDAPPDSGDEDTSLDEFLAVDAGGPGETQATIGRLLSFPAIALTIGGLAFLWTTLRGERAEIRRSVDAVRISGVVVAIGAAVEYGGVASIADESLTDAWTSSPGTASAMRIVAGLAVALGLRAVIVAAGPTPRSLSSAADTSTSPNVTSPVVPPVGESASEDLRRGSPQLWVPTRASTLAFVGCALMVISFWFDGHTVSKGWRPLHAVTNSVHVAAGSIWVGGVVAMVAVVWSRRRRGRPSRALDLVVRFSTVAAVALAAVVVAGLIMAVSILDSFGDLTGTEWGQLLLLKSGAVGLAALCGAYNHFRLLPALNSDPDDPLLSGRLRSVLTSEAILLVFVVIVTVWLVTAAT
ncbi:copper resistance CopC/CopD family protein [Ilumatobacter nonamiensis]|uniref:copper resistance CopC/CopD family protein n=1 Tax=Ilumatobacter nonamiensis TaxID=467093 RepID=UPI000345E3E6|nr:CopD family protein [Ilumatobacter nonamiensis]